MALIQDLRERKLTGCPFCDGVRTTLYRGLDLWAPSRPPRSSRHSRIEVASDHDSFDASALGAFAESPLNARGPAGLPLCAATVDSIGSASGNLATTAGTKTLSGSAEQVNIKRTPGMDEEDLDDFCYGFKCTGLTSGQSFDFRGTNLDLITNLWRSNSTSAAAATILDRIDVAATQVNWEIVYDDGEPGWSNGEDVNCECSPGVFTSNGVGFTLTLEGPSPGPPHEFPVCPSGIIETPQSGLFYNTGGTTDRRPLISSGFTGPNEYIAHGNVGVPGRELLAYFGYNLASFGLFPVGAQFDAPTKTGVDSGDSCWTSMGASTWFRIRQMATADVDGRVTYSWDWISSRHFGAGDMTLQLLGVSEAL